MDQLLLDTNVLSEFKRRGAPDPNVAEWLRHTDPDLLWVSVLSLGEIRKGIERLAPGARREELDRWLQYELTVWFEDRILPVTRSISERWGALSARAFEQGRPLSSIDGLTAATAAEHELTVATRNITDFSGFGVKLINPWVHVG